MKEIYTSLKRKMVEFISNLIDTDDRIEYLRHYDSLTELPNRKILIDRFDTLMKFSEEKERAILVINIDRLHSINELYGRTIGDEVVLKLTNRLQQLFTGDSKIFREDHFYLCLDGVSADELEKTGQEILKLISEPLEIDGRKFHVTVSVGISHYPSTGENINMLLHQAEIAMLKVKMDGKNDYSIILKEDIREIERKRKLEFDLKDVLNRDELYLVYQPEVCLKTGEIKAAEALIRWEHPELGNIPPIEFIPVAEETGVINDLGKWVIRKAAREAKEWHKQGLKICLAVNISYVQFKDKLLVQNIIGILESVDFDPSYFIVEITESLMKDLEYIELATKELNEHEIRIAIDDFGTGYSSLSVLGNMYIDMIKIDQTFVKNLPEDEKSVQIVKTMIQIGENLDSIVVAEGVETLEQLNFLLENECKYAQGYYFSRPVSSEGIIEYGQRKQGQIIEK